MFVYLDVDAPIHKVHINPGRHLAELGINEFSDSWKEPDGKTPREMVLEFVHGRTEVDELLGRYLVEYGIASDSRPHHRIIRPRPGQILTP